MVSLLIFIIFSIVLYMNWDKFWLLKDINKLKYRVNFVVLLMIILFWFIVYDIVIW